MSQQLELPNTVWSSDVDRLDPRMDLTLKVEVFEGDTMIVSHITSAGEIRNLWITKDIDVKYRILMKENNFLPKPKMDMLRKSSFDSESRFEVLLKNGSYQPSREFDNWVWRDDLGPSGIVAFRLAIREDEK